MSADPIHAPKIDQVGSIRPGTSAPSAHATERSARFESLLADLQDKAERLADAARGELDAESLKRAVSEARTTLDGAMELSDSLLEAYRASIHDPERNEHS